MLESVKRYGIALKNAAPDHKAANKSCFLHALNPLLYRSRPVGVGTGGRRLRRQQGGCVWSVWRVNRDWPSPRKGRRSCDTLEVATPFPSAIAPAVVPGRIGKMAAFVPGPFTPFAEGSTFSKKDRNKKSFLPSCASQHHPSQPKTSLSN